MSEKGYKTGERSPNLAGVHVEAGANQSGEKAVANRRPRQANRGVAHQHTGGNRRQQQHNGVLICEADTESVGTERTPKLRRMLHVAQEYEHCDGSGQAVEGEHLSVESEVPACFAKGVEEAAEDCGGERARETQAGAGDDSCCSGG